MQYAWTGAHSLSYNILCRTCKSAVLLANCRPYAYFADKDTITITSPVWDIAALCLSMAGSEQDSDAYAAAPQLVSTKVSYRKPT